MAKKKAKTRAFKKEWLQALLWEELGGEIDAKIVQDEITDNSRWSICHDLVFSFEGKFYLAPYSVGATESQDEAPWQYDDDEVTCFEVKPVKKTITVYE